MAQLLLVEDNAPDRKLLARRLKSKGYDVIEAADGQESIEKATAELPDLILMDLDLPKINGWEATRQLKAAPATAQIPVMAITAHAMVGDRDRAIEAGCDEYETKPIRLPHLLEKIGGFLAPEPSQAPTCTANTSLSAEDAPKTSSQAVDVQSTPQPLADMSQASTAESTSPQALSNDSPGVAEMTSPNPSIPSTVESNPSIFNSAPAQAPTSDEQAVSLSAEDPTETTASSTKGSAGTILVVDDILNNRKLLIRRLGRKGYKVIDVDSGLAALEAIATNPSIDLVLLDIMMPGMDGIETLERIRQTHSSNELPIIMATAKDASRDMVTAFSKGANDYITKPIDFPVALARIQAQITMLQAIQGAISEEEPAPQSKLAFQQKSDLLPAETAAGEIQDRLSLQTVGLGQQNVESQSQTSAVSTMANWENTQDSLSLPQRFACMEVVGEDIFGTTALVKDSEQTFIRRNCLLEEIKSSALGQQNNLVNEMRQRLAKHQQDVKAIRERGFNTRLVDVVEQDNNFYILHKMNRGQSLQATLSHKSQPESIPVVLQLMASLLRAINPVHQCQFTHAYLRAQDFHYLENTEFLVLTNVGLRQRLLWEMASKVGNIYSSLEQAHVAPEARQGNACQASDLYSIGIIGLQALTGKQADELPVDGKGFVNWEEIVPSSNPARSIFQSLLSPSPELRFSSTNKALNEIMSQWFKQSQMRAA